MNRRALYTLFGFVLLVALIITARVMYVSFQNRMHSVALDGTVISTEPLAPDVQLTDQYGRPFRLSTQSGRVVALFFGYTHCPDVCPATLAKLASAYRLLGSRAKDVVVAFITVDPERDRTAELKRYVALFNPNFLGLTGHSTALNSMYQAFHVWHQRLPSHGSAAGYLMAHSSAIYLVDPQRRWRVIHDWTDAPADIAHDMKALL